MSVILCLPGCHCCRCVSEHSPYAWSSNSETAAKQNKTEQKTLKYYLTVFQLCPFSWMSPCSLLITKDLSMHYKVQGMGCHICSWWHPHPDSIIICWVLSARLASCYISRIIMGNILPLQRSSTWTLKQLAQHYTANKARPGLWALFGFLLGTVVLCVNCVISYNGCILPLFTDEGKHREVKQFVQDNTVCTRHDSTLEDMGYFEGR